MAPLHTFEKLYQKAVQECKLSKSSLFNINFSKNSPKTHRKKQHHEYSLGKDLYYLWSGLRDVVLLDYVVMRDSDCLDLEKLSKYLNHDDDELKINENGSENDENNENGGIGIMMIKFWMFFDGKREEMKFNYLINIEKLRKRLKKLTMHGMNDLIFIDIDALDRKEPYLEMGIKLEKNIQPFIEFISNHLLENLHEIGKFVFEIDFSTILHPQLAFIPFDATLMNGILLNYPIVMFYGSRFCTENQNLKFHANHVLNNIDLYRYIVRNIVEDSSAVEGDEIIQFIIPQSIYSEHSNRIDSSIEKWLGNFTEKLKISKSSIQYDNIVL